MGRPIIGITSELDAARWGDWIREAAVSPVSYTRAVERAGGAPVIVPPVPPASVAAYIESFDGLVFSGGRDMDPSLYDQERLETSDEPDRRRDRFELALMRAALEADVPFLAIGRGLHVLAARPRRHAHPGPAGPPRRAGPLHAARRGPRRGQPPRQAARRPGPGARRAPPGPLPPGRRADRGRLVARRRGHGGRRGGRAPLRRRGPLAPGGGRRPPPARRVRRGGGRARPARRPSRSRRASRSR